MQFVHTVLPRLLDFFVGAEISENSLRRCYLMEVHSSIVFGIRSTVTFVESIIDYVDKEKLAISFSRQENRLPFDWRIVGIRTIIVGIALNKWK